MEETASLKEDPEVLDEAPDVWEEVEEIDEGLNGGSCSCFDPPLAFSFLGFLFLEPWGWDLVPLQEFNDDKGEAIPFLGPRLVP